MDSLPQDDTPRKQCINSDCQRWFPATPQFFHRVKNGLNNQCKECKNRKSKAYYHKPENHERIKGLRHQPEFRAKNREEKRKLYAQPEKRAELLESKRLRYRRPEVHAKVLAYSRLPEVQARHRERSRRRGQRLEYKAWRREYDREYRQRPGIREHKRIYSREYYRRPGVHERLRTYQNEYWKVFSQRPDQRMRARIKTNTRLVRKKAIEGTYTHQQIQDLLKRQKYRCYYAACGHAKFGRRGKQYIYHIEHTFPISRVAGTDIPANDISYLVLACPHCNDSKGNKYPWEWPEGGRLL